MIPESLVQLMEKDLHAALQLTNTVEAFLTDNSIDCYAHLLACSFPEKKICAIPTVKVSSIIKGEQHDGDKIFMKSMAKSEVFFCPFILNSHVCFIAANLQARTVKYYDSLYPNDWQEKATRVGEWLLSQLRKDPAAGGDLLPPTFPSAARQFFPLPPVERCGLRRVCLPVHESSCHRKGVQFHQP